MERRFAQVEVRAKDGKITGTASPTYNGSPDTEYELWEGTYERFSAGAFDNHLESKPDIVGLFNHDPNAVLGRTPDTLKLRTDSKGLHYEIDPPDTQVARDLMTSIARGDIRGSSFAFTADDVEWRLDGGKSVRLIKRAKLYDVSVVTSPAYGGSTCHLRSSDKATLERERDEYESAKRFAKFEQLMNT